MASDNIIDNNRTVLNVISEAEYKIKGDYPTMDVSIIFLFIKK